MPLDFTHLLEPSFQAWLKTLQLPLGEACLLAGFDPTPDEIRALDELGYALQDRVLIELRAKSTAARRPSGFSLP